MCAHNHKRMLRNCCNNVASLFLKILQKWRRQYNNSKRHYSTSNAKSQTTINQAYGTNSFMFEVMNTFILNIRVFKYQLGFK